ncbi:hypothetical protein VTK73DRAFT_6203 [Phialemonium thermophilum]|uniref:Secreted protein n=1 Tax=Phialemonium thermophilum TaxID=223376 RepID=A0ABR3UZU9_9PEZI
MDLIVVSALAGLFALVGWPRRRAKCFDGFRFCLLSTSLRRILRVLIDPYAFVVHRFSAQAKCRNQKVYIVSS